MDSPSPSNAKRLWNLGAILATIALGLASRRWPGMFPEFLGKYPGDALWAMMVFFGLQAITPRKSVLIVAACALGTAYGVEFLKLYQAPWIIAVRRSTLGHLVFGHVFTWQNFIAYAVGVAMGVILFSFKNASTRLHCCPREQDDKA